jgi:hypothetical protein
MKPSARVLTLLALVPTALATGTSALAAVIHQTIHEQAPFVFTNPCNGEVFAGTADFLIVETALSTPSGINHFTQNGFSQLRGETASGVQYTSTLVFTIANTTPNEPPPPNQIDVLANPTFHVIRQGEDGTDDDFFLHVVLIGHLDLATGTSTLEMTHFRSECS